MGPAGQEHPVRASTRRAACRRAPPPSSVAAGPAVRRGRHRRCRRPGARGRGRADAALPDENPHPVRRLDLDELDVGARRKRAVGGQRRPETVEAVGRRQRAQDDALGIAHPEHRGRARSRRPRPARFREGPRAGPSRRGRCSARRRGATRSSVFVPAPVSTVTTAPGARSCTRARCAARHRKPLPESSDGLPSAFHKPHRRALRRSS